MKRLLLILTVYVLASVGVQAQVINPDGLKEMWVNDKINGKIHISPDSTSYFHFSYIYSNPKILKLYKRDLLTNDILAEKDIDDYGDDRRMPEMAISPDGKYIITSLNRILNQQTPILDTLFVYDQQNLEFIKTIHLDIEEMTEGIYDPEDLEEQNVMIYHIYDIMFITAKKFTVKGGFNADYFWPDDVKINGNFSCIYNIETGEFINEYYITKPGKVMYIDNYKVSSDKMHVLVKSAGSLNHMTINQFLDIIENENELKDNERVLHSSPATYAYNIEGDMICMGLKNSIAIYDLKNHELIANDKMNYYKSESAIINKQFITINNRENIHAVALYDFINKKFYNLIDKVTAFGQHTYIKHINYLIFNVGNWDDGEQLTAYQFDIDTIVDVREPSEIIDTLYPNPTQEYISLETGKTYTNYEIIDMSGIIISEGAIANSAGGKFTINISELASGTYFLRMLTVTSVDTYQFLKID